MTETLSTWDVDDDDFKDNENLIYDEKTGLYNKIIETHNEDGKPCRQILQYKLQTFEVSESVKARKLLKKFGKAKNDAPGPNPAQTYLGDEIFMKFFTDEILPTEEEKKTPFQTVRCKQCHGEHFSHKCPYKEEIKNIYDLTVQIESIKAESGDKKMIPENILKPANSGAYVPPHMRDSTPRTFSDKRRADSAFTVRVSNLPEAAQETDLDDLFRPFGIISRTFLVKDRQTGSSRGFAYVTFLNRTDAAKAIEGVNGFGYDHCILQVQWSE